MLVCSLLPRFSGTAGERSGSSNVGERFPWTFPVRVDDWVPLISDAPKTSDIAPDRIFGAIQRGAYYVELTKAQYDGFLAETRAVSSSRSRS